MDSALQGCVVISELIRELYLKRFTAEVNGLFGYKVVSFKPNNRTTPTFIFICSINLWNRQEIYQKNSLTI